MKPVFKDFAFGILRQLLDWSKPRDEKIILTRYACERIKEHRLDIETLEDVFRHGEGKGHKLVQRYAKATSVFMTNQQKVRGGILIIGM